MRTHFLAGAVSNRGTEFVVAIHSRLVRSREGIRAFAGGSERLRGVRSHGGERGPPTLIPRMGPTGWTAGPA
jgi:hypothetical protein